MGFKRVHGRGVPEWLNIRTLKGGDQFWIRYRKGGVYLEERLEGATQREAVLHGNKLLAQAMGRPDAKPVALVRMETLCDEVVELKKGKSPATYQLNEIISRVHVKPFLNAHCPYVSSLNATTWDQYKIYKRLQNPTVALFNHWKFFVNVGKHAHQTGRLEKPVRFEFSEKKEDFREAGQVIPDGELARILTHASQMWRDRIILQRFTGMRPGEVRCLRKDRVDVSKGIISLKKEDTKTRRPRSFRVRSPMVLEILRRRLAASTTDFFFPARGDLNQPIDKHLTGWHEAIATANSELKRERKPLMPTSYTPHDLRHTFLTNEFKKPGANPALICYMAGLSIEEAQETYLHFTAEDTAGMAEELAKEAALLRA